MIRQTIYDKPDYSERLWKGISAEAKEVVDGLLTKYRGFRFDLETAMNMPWLAECNATSMTTQKAAISQECLGKLGAFKFTPK